MGIVPTPPYPSLSRVTLVMTLIQAAPHMHRASIQYLELSLRVLKDTLCKTYISQFLLKRLQ